MIAPHQVSIPAGFSDALRLNFFKCVLICNHLFQSLLGFLMRCDRPVNSDLVTYAGVSIPAGFSDALRLPLMV